MSPILAAQYWKSNAELIADVARLGYLGGPDAFVLDPTYGKGNWWKIYRPVNLLDRCNVRTPHWDFTNMDYPDELFDAVAYDPPYVCVGGRKTTGIAGMHAAYGLTNAPKTPIDLQALIDDGLRECARVLKPKGHLLCKCQDYVSSGKLWSGTYHTTHRGLSIGLELVDRFEHIAKASRAQPGGRRQVHARRNLSTLLVFRKPR